MSFRNYVHYEGYVPLLEGDGKTFLNVYGEFINENNEPIPTPKNKDGDATLLCSGWDGVKLYRVIDLMVFQFKPMFVPRNRWSEISAFCLDGDKENLHANNIGYRFTKGPIEVNGFPNFFYCPSLTNVALNVHGTVLDLETMTTKDLYVFKKLNKNIKGGYKTLTANFSPKKTTITGLHRLLCYTFKDYPDNVEELVTNHIDGNPENNNLDNLELISFSENNLHAYKNGLRSQNKPVLRRNVRTGEVVEYFSLSECARQMGYKKDTLLYDRLKKEFSKVWQDGFQFKYKEDPREWIIPEDAEQTIKDAQPKIVPILVRNCFTKEIVKYDSVYQASKTLGMNNSSVQMLITGDISSPMFGYQFKRADDPRPWVEYPEKVYIESLNPNSLKVNARNLITGEEKLFQSTREAALELGNTHIYQKLKNGFQPLLASGWQLKRENWDWEEIEDPELAIYLLEETMSARHLESNKVYIANNGRHMASILGLDPCVIRFCALNRGNVHYKGYQFMLGSQVSNWPDSPAREFTYKDMTEKNFYRPVKE